VFFNLWNDPVTVRKVLKPHVWWIADNGRIFDAPHREVIGVDQNNRIVKVWVILPEMR
jgi:hypothetical protein